MEQKIKNSTFFLMLVLPIGMLGASHFGLFNGLGSVLHSMFVKEAGTSTTPFVYTFNENGILYESGSLLESSSPYFWLNSGGKLIIKDGVGTTVLGNLRSLDPWRLLYASSNPRDTDDGYHPQNLFRLVTKGIFENVREELEFEILENNFSQSINRNMSNGLLLFSRYKDESNLYYAGIRVDGMAVIKKKYKGVYYTMAEKTVFPGIYTGERDAQNLLPKNEWLALRSDTTTDATGSVTVRLFMRREKETEWKLLLQAKDAGKMYGETPPLYGPGHVGIRTDFMDVAFRNYRVDILHQNPTAAR